MSDYDRGKYYPKKKFHSTSTQNDHSSNSFGRSFFSNRSSHYSSKYDKEQQNKESKPESPTKLKQPKLLIKTRETTDETISSAASPSRSKPKESELSTTITIQSSGCQQEVTNPTPPKQMKKSVKFLNDSMLLTDNVQDFVQDNNEFLVVGIVGSQGVGKSTILNLLAHNKVTSELKKSLFRKCDSNVKEDEYGDCIKILTENLSNLSPTTNTTTTTTTPTINEINSNNIKHEIFKIETTDDIENISNATEGIDLFITSNRVILLDCEPILSIAVLDDLVENENKRSSIVSEFIPLENTGEIYGLQLTSFLMSVCHVLIVVQDWFFDSNIIRFLQTAEMLKPTNSNPEDDFTDHFPHLLLIHNRAEMVDFAPFKFKKMQQIYRKLFHKSKMHIETNLGLGDGRLISCLNPENCDDPINVFLIPEYDLNLENNIYKGHPPFEDLIKKLRANILKSTRYPLTHIQLSEKTWLSYCQKVWDNVKKSSFFVEYTKLMP